MTDDQKDPKRGKVTAENLEEARKLRALFAAKREQLKAAGHGTQGAFGAEFGIGNQAAVGFFLNGKTALSLKAAVGFARGLGCSVADFSPRLAALQQQLASDVGPQSFKDLQGPEAQLVMYLRSLVETDGAEVADKLLDFVAELIALPVGDKAAAIFAAAQEAFTPPEKRIEAHKRAAASSERAVAKPMPEHQASRRKPPKKTQQPTSASKGK